MNDSDWTRAMDSAASQFESYVRQGKIETSEQRRAALDDAFQHAYGILSLALHKREQALRSEKQYALDCLNAAKEEIERLNAEVAEWRQVAEVEAGLRRELTGCTTLAWRPSQLIADHHQPPTKGEGE